MTSRITPIDTSGHDYHADIPAAAPAIRPPPPPSGSTRPHARPEGSTRQRLGNMFTKGSASTPSTPAIDPDARRREIRAQRSARETSPVPSEMATQIRQALANVKNHDDAKVLMFGYSPTGGGHTGRTLNILEESLKARVFKKNDVVFANVPSIWNNKPRPAQLGALLASFKQAGVEVLMVEAEKSVHGYLKDDGSSDDVSILHRMAMHPWRSDADITTVTQAKAFHGPGDIAGLPSIDANHLVDSAIEILGDEHLDKLYMLSDMDPPLEKAGKRMGAPGEQRVDQQNHGILLDLDDRSANLKPNMAVLSKVLGGYGERVGHIGLGEKNTLLPMHAMATSLGVTAETTKQEALHDMSALFFKHAQTVDVGVLQEGGPGNGILHHPELKSASDVQNMVYVYANDNQAEIAAAVAARIEAHDPSCMHTLFVFCGGGVFKDTAPKHLNALHMTYLADADGITTAGAGTVGEFCYLHKAGDAQSNLLAIPIKDHNEQEANAIKGLRSDEAVNGNVTIAQDLAENPLKGWVRTFVSDAEENIDAKYAGHTMQAMLDAVGKEDTYPLHGSKLLSGEEDMTPQEQRIASIEREMNASTVLNANRHFMKLVYQAVHALKPIVLSEPPPASGIRKLGRRLSGAKSIPAAPIRIKLRKDDTPLEFKDARDLKRFLKDRPALTRYLADGQNVSANDILLLDEAKNVFADIAAGTSTGQAAVDKMDRLREKFGHQFVTGF